MKIRLLEKKDKDEYLELINVFTREPQEITREDFEKWYDLSFEQNALIYVLLKRDKIVGTGKLLLEYKFNNNLTPVSACPKTSSPLGCIKPRATIGAAAIASTQVASQPITPVK